MPQATETKAQLIETMRNWRERWEDALFAIGEDCMLCPGVAGEWSARDIVAHAAAYERWLMEWLEASSRGASARPSPLDDADPQRRDRAAHQLTRSFPLDLVLGDSWLTWERLLVAVERLPEQDLLDSSRAPEFVRHRWGAGTPLAEAVASMTYEHYRDHLPALQAAANDTPCPELVEEPCAC
ncbi:MAG TPA: hypothetical protein VF808_04145 [Ktedonobacterales bacterium]